MHKGHMLATSEGCKHSNSEKTKILPKVFLEEQVHSCRQTAGKRQLKKQLKTKSQLILAHNTDSLNC